MKKNVLFVVFVSFCVCVSAQVGVKLSCPDDKHPHAIDLGLPSGYKWACCNSGAKDPKDYGTYYAAYSSDELKNCPLITQLKLSDDWDTPLVDLFDELVQHCNYTWNMIDDVEGCVFTSKENGKSIFIPFGGWIGKYGSEFINKAGCYWSKSDQNKLMSYSITAVATRSDIYRKNLSEFHSLPVRLVLTPKNLALVYTDELEVRPSFPGGHEKLLEWLKENYQYLEEKVKKGVEDRVVVQFVLEKDGLISDSKILFGKNLLLNEEALRLFNSMPKWNPGIYKHKPVRTKNVLTIDFEDNEIVTLKLLLGVSHSSPE